MKLSGIEWTGEWTFHALCEWMANNAIKICSNKIKKYEKKNSTNKSLTIVFDIDETEEITAKPIFIVLICWMCVGHSSSRIKKAQCPSMSDTVSRWDQITKVFVLYRLQSLSFSKKLLLLSCVGQAAHTHTHILVRTATKREGEKENPRI